MLPSVRSFLAEYNRKSRDDSLGLPSVNQRRPAINFFKALMKPKEIQEVASDNCKGQLYGARVQKLHFTSHSKLLLKIKCFPESKQETLGWEASSSNKMSVIASQGT